MPLHITLDTDWAAPSTLEHVLAEVIDPRLALTVFCTGRYACLEARPHTEVALHYNVEQLGFERAFNEIAAVLPGAKGARGHSLAFSERLRPLYRRHGTRYDSSFLQFEQQGIAAFPIARGVWEFPVYFMDTFFLEYHEGDFGRAPTAEQLAGPGLKVLDFHPIHLLLNTPSIDFYQSVKHLYHDTEALLRHRHQGWGVASLFAQIQEQALAGPQQTLLELAEELDGRRAGEAA
jgi:hypothetical protein